MGDARSLSHDSRLARLRAALKRGAREQTVYHPRDYKAQWFYLGYQQAIHDIERTGGRPLTEKVIRESAERSLRTWVNTGAFAAHRMKAER